MVGLQGAGGVKNFSVGICDGAPSTAHSSIALQRLQKYNNYKVIAIQNKELLVNMKVH